MGSIVAGGGDLEAARGGGISERGPSSMDYEVVPVAGFKILPAVIRDRLLAEGVIGTKSLCASCENLKVRRRADGTHYQSGTAWWGDESSAAIIWCRREMEFRSDQKFSPSGAWDVTGVKYHLGDVGGPEISKWKFDGKPAGGDGASPPVVTNDPLDLLPPDVAAPVRGGLSDVWMRHSSSSATEHLTAIRVFDNEVLLLEANRTARTEVNLFRSEWKLTTLRASINESETFAFACGQKGSAAPAVGDSGSTRDVHRLRPGA